MSPIRSRGFVLCPLQANVLPQSATYLARRKKVKLFLDLCHLLLLCFSISLDVNGDRAVRAKEAGEWNISFPINGSVDSQINLKTSNYQGMYSTDSQPFRDRCWIWGTQGMRASGPTFLHFHVVFKKKWSNSRLALT